MKESFNRFSELLAQIDLCRDAVGMWERLTARTPMEGLRQHSGWTVMRQARGKLGDDRAKEDCHGQVHLPTLHSLVRRDDPCPIDSRWPWRPWAN